jgi:hypothetical protein
VQAFKQAAVAQQDLIAKLKEQLAELQKENDRMRGVNAAAGSSSSSGSMWSTLFGLSTAASTTTSNSITNTSDTDADSNEWKKDSGATEAKLEITDPNTGKRYVYNPNCEKKLPADWKEYTDVDDESSCFYVNWKTGMSQWECP